MTHIAYLVSEYHAPSHTFIRREIAALRAEGLKISPYSIKRSTAVGQEQVPHILGSSLLTYGFALLWGLLTRPVTLVSVWLMSLAHRPPGVKALLWSQFHFVEAVTLARMLDRNEVKRLHSHFANSGATVGLLAARLAKIRWSLTLHGISETDYPAGATLAAKLRAADFVACASWFMRAQGMRLVDASHWPKFSIVRCGLDMDHLPDVPPLQAKRPNGDDVKIVCVGRLSAEKGYPGLFKALAELNSPQPYSLTIVGDGPLRGELEEAAERYGIGGRITFKGALPETETLQEIGKSDLLVLPSLMEGLPVVLIEAMALGKPVLTSGVAGIPELVKSGVNGVMFAPANWAELRDGLARLVANSDERATLGGNARESVRTEFDIKNAVKPLISRFAA